MRYMIMHKTSAQWEAGAKPSLDVIQRVGAMVGEMRDAGVLLAGDGLAPSAQGARVRLSAGEATVTPGPFDGAGALPARYALYRAATIDEAAGLAARFGRIFGDGVVDVRPANEPWDLGFGSKPAGLETRRYMAVVNATGASEAGTPLGPAASAALDAFAGELGRSGALLGIEHFEPSARGKRLRPAAGSKAKRVVMDGPFSETKELIGGFVTVEVPTIDDAVRWAQLYAEVVDVEEVDVRGLERLG